MTTISREVFNFFFTVNKSQVGIDIREIVDEVMGLPINRLLTKIFSRVIDFSFL